MRKVIWIVFVMAFSTLIGVSGFTKSRIRNPAEMEIVPPAAALIATIGHKPFDITVHKDGVNGDFVTPAQAKASVKITNHSANDLVIKGIRCVTAGFSDGAITHFRPLLPAGRTMLADFSVADGRSLVNVRTLTFELTAEWDGGKTTLQFDVPVDQREDGGQTAVGAGVGPADANGPGDAGAAAPDQG